jgi:plasmid stabilization system protein ParE
VRIEWSQAAVADLQAITDWIEQDRGIETAIRIARHIYEAVQSLRTMPYRGRYGRIENTLELVLPRLPYLVVYQISEERLHVLNVLHGAQRWP